MFVSVSCRIWTISFPVHFWNWRKTKKNTPNQNVPQQQTHEQGSSIIPNKQASSVTVQQSTSVSMQISIL